MKKFMQHLKQISNLFPFMPLAKEGGNENDCIEGFSEVELGNILKKASPCDWKETQGKSNIHF